MDPHSISVLEYLLPIAISVLVTAGVGVYVLRKQRVAGALSFAVAVICEFIWNIGFLFELFSPTLNGKIFWDNLQWIPTLAIPLAWLSFAWEYTGRRFKHPARLWAGLIAIPVLTIGLIFSNPLHGLAIHSIQLIPTDIFPQYTYQFGTLLWIGIAYDYLIVLAGIVVLLDFARQQRGVHKVQTWIMVAGFIIPLLGTLPAILNITIGSQRDISPFTFGLANLLIAVGLFRFRIFDLIPYARELVIDRMEDGVIVLDELERLSDINPAAKILLDRPEITTVGLPFSTVLQELAGSVDLSPEKESWQQEIFIARDGTQKVFDARIARLASRTGKYAGHLIILRDISQQKLAEARLENAYSEIQQQVAERTVELSATVAHLEEEINERQLLEEKLRESAEFRKRVFDSSRVPIMVIDAETYLCIDCNPAALKIYRFSSMAEILGKTPRDVSPPEQYDGTSSETLTKFYIDKALAEGMVVFDWRHQRPDGEIWDGEVHLMSFRSGQRQLLQFTVQDITERKRIEAWVRRQSEKTQALMELSSALLGIEPDADQILQLSVRRCAELIGDGASIFRYDPDQPNLSLAAVYNPDPELSAFFRSAIEKKPLGADEGSYGKVIRSNEALLIPEIDMAQLLAEASEERRVYYQKLPIYSAMYAPLSVEGRCTGVLGIARHSPDRPRYTQEDFVFFKEVADLSALAISRARIYADLKKELSERERAEENARQASEELHRAYEATLEGWSQALELRELETAEHSQRVVELTLVMARKMGFSEAECVHIRRGALLHDIGKMGIPDHILLKPARLTDDEWKMMRQHPVFAQQLLSGIPYLAPALVIPYAHHERWDGSGYPLGLKGKDIPLVARIFAVVDVWDALLQNRPYRQGWSEAETLQYLKDNAGIQFDPRVVENFLEVVRESG